ncbi:MAG TPA: F0F1 ATP synthase subunit delta, partial [Marmoricola sp.]
VRRAATDPAGPAAAKTKLLTTLFGAHVGPDAAAVIAEAGQLRWASSVDFTDALERLGVAAIVRAADAEGDGDRVESELFTFGRAVADNSELRDALSDPARSTEDKQELVASLLDGRAAPATVRLAKETVTGASRTVSAAVDQLIEMAAQARGRHVATVRTAAPLSDSQLDRLSRALGDEGRPVHLNVLVDPGMIGGLRVEMGDYVIDGSVQNRLDDVRRRIAG